MSTLAVSLYDDATLSASSKVMVCVLLQGTEGAKLAVSEDEPPLEYILQTLARFREWALTQDPTKYHFGCAPVSE